MRRETALDDAGPACLTRRMAEIPDEAWGNPDGLLARLATRFASTKAGSWTVRSLMPLDRKIMLRTEGRRTVLGPVGAPTMLLETIGRKSGQPRISPLLFARDGHAIVVVGSNFGQEHHPAWTGNLLANPSAVAIVRGHRFAVRGELLAGAQAEAAYQLMVGVASTYASYKGRTDREIRVFRLTPVDSTGAA